MEQWARAICSLLKTDLTEVDTKGVGAVAARCTYPAPLASLATAKGESVSRRAVPERSEGREARRELPTEGLSHVQFQYLALEPAVVFDPGFGLGISRDHTRFLCKVLSEFQTRF